MALSGYIQNDFGPSNHYTLRISWTATQDITANQSTITATAKMWSDSSWSMYASATKYGHIVIDGVSTQISDTISTGGGKWIQLGSSVQKTVTHDTDGTYTFTLDGDFNFDVYVNGTHITDVTLTSTAFKLDTIPRESKLSNTSAPNFTAGDDVYVSITRYSSSYTHTVSLQLLNTSGSWVTIATNTGVGTSTTFNMNDSATNADATQCFSTLAQRSSCSSRILIDTYSGGTHIGSQNSYTGTCTAPAPSTVSDITGNLSSDTVGVYVDQAWTINISRKNGYFTHTVQVYSGGNDPATATLVKTFSNVSTNTGSFTLTTGSTGEQMKVYNTTPNYNSVDGNIIVTTYFNGVKVGGTTDNDLNFYVRNSNPTFGTGYTWADTNGLTSGVTNDSTLIIQGQSTLVVSLPTSANAQAINGATMKSYSATINKVTKTAAYSASATITFNFGTVDASTNQTLSVTAIDSRGNKVTTTKTVTIIPYSPPVVKTTATRNNGFDDATTITLNGSYSLLTIGGVTKNLLKTVTYAFKKTSDTAYPTTGTGSPAPFTYTTSSGSYTATNASATLANTDNWNVYITVQDSLTTNHVTLTVPAGKPIFFIDANNKSLGFNDFPQNPNEFRVNGRIVFGQNMWGTTIGGEGAGAMFLNNSDITGLNGLWFNDSSQGRGEGLLFLKSTSTIGSQVSSDYDNLYMRDTALYINDGTTGLAIQAPNQHIKFQRTVNSTNVIEWHMESASGNFQLVKTGDSTKFSIDTTGQLNMWDTLDMNNNNISNANHITIADIGPTEGIEWLGGSGWKIVETTDTDGSTSGSLRFRTGTTVSSDQMYIANTGNVYANGGFYVAKGGGVYVTTNSVGNNNNALYIGSSMTGSASIGGGTAAIRVGTTAWQGGSNSSGLMYFGRDGTGEQIWSPSIYNRSYTGSSANVVVTSFGTLGCNSSARRFKLLEQDIENEIAYRILNINPKTWFDKWATEAYADAIANGVDLDKEDIPDVERVPGLVAEDLEDAGLQLYVTYEPDGNGGKRTRSVMYDRAWTLLIPIVRDQKAKIEELEARLAKGGL